MDVLGLLALRFPIVWQNLGMAYFNIVLDWHPSRFQIASRRFLRMPFGDAPVLPVSIFLIVWPNLGKFAFGGCTSLTSIEIPHQETRIGQGVFEGCTSLTSISIPNSVTEIGDYAFNRCTSLSNVIIPQKITRIGRSAFERCNLTYIEIPKSVEEIGFSAFGYCYSFILFKYPIAWRLSIHLPSRVARPWHK